MSIEPIGLLTLIIGFICLQFGQRATVTVVVVASLFGAAAALVIGSANIQPAHLLFGFLAVSVFRQHREAESAIKAVQPPSPGFWLMCMVMYGIAMGFVIPRLFAGSMPIIPLGTSEYADTGGTVPLGPVSSNFTHAVYMTADVLCFAMIVAVASTSTGFVTVTNALLAYVAGNVLFALLDIATYNTGTQWLLEFMRNAKYTLHIEEEVIGLKRIVGSFPEASTFAHSTLGALGFTGTLWLCGRRPRLTGSLALASLALSILSTSSTGLVSTPPVLLILYVTLMMRSGFNMSRPWSSAFLLCAPLLIVAAVLALQLDDETARPVRNYLDELIFSKSNSSSGAERNNWNTVGLQNFFDSFGIGVGLGTVRTSSFVVALLANVGVPGTIFYLFFAASAFLRKRGTPRSFPSDVRLAARNACLGLLIGDFLASPAVDQGLLFYVFAALCCAEPERMPASVPSTQMRHAGARI